MSLIREILEKYDILCDYCEKFWHNVSKNYPQDIACHEGCGICCELQSVNLLEAYSIYSALRHKAKKTESEKKKPCVFLVNDTCSIYSSRPVICRTHGLMIRSVEFTSRFSITCSYNFHHTENVSQNAILDIDSVTKNLMRLNYAFCMTIDNRGMASERVFLSEIATDSLASEIQNVFKRL